jgi:hypothetical protein
MLTNWPRRIEEEEDRRIAKPQHGRGGGDKKTQN